MASQKLQNAGLLDHPDIASPAPTIEAPRKTKPRDPQGTKDMVLSDRRDQRLDVLPAAPADALLQMIERLAARPDFDVQKLKEMVALQERILDRNAKAAFDAAFSAMQPEIPEIDEHGRVKNKAGEIQSHYAKNEDIQKVLRPILARHGFSLSFKTEWLDNGNKVKVTGVLGHRDGHEKTSEFQSKADDSGNKNAIQGLGSATSYGRRYTTMDLLNITSREPGRGADDDGQTAEQFKQPDAPDGYDAWWAGLEVLAAEGFKVLSDAWNKSNLSFRTWNARHEKHKWEELKKVALGVDRMKAATK